MAHPSRTLLTLALLGMMIPPTEQAAYDDLLDQAERGADTLLLEHLGMLLAEMAGKTQDPSGRLPVNPRHDRVDHLRARLRDRWLDLPTRMATGADDLEGRWKRLLWRALTCDPTSGQYGSRHIHGEAVDLLLGIP